MHMERSIGRSLRLAACALLLTLVAAGAADAQEAGALRGTVWDNSLSAPIGGVRVAIIEALLTTTSDEDGNFIFKSVPPGSYTVSFYKSGYDRFIKSDVVVVPGEVRDIRADIDLEIIQMDELVVTGADLLGGTELQLLELRQEATQLTDSLSTEMMSKAGDSDLAGALKKVVGLSVSQGKYATIRGLSDRYTGTTLNGVRIPSADPRRRAVQVDMFPTSTVESVTVYKTFTPDLHGDFTGGGVNIKTKSVPEGPILSVSGSLRSNSAATFNRDFLTYSGGGVFGDDRSLRPDGYIIPSKQLNNVTASVNPTPENMQAAVEYDRLTRAFSPVIGTSTKRPSTTNSFSLTLGNRYELGRRGVVGLIGSFTTRRNYGFYENGVNNNGAVNEGGAVLAAQNLRSDTKGSDELLSGFLGTVVWQPNERNEFSLRSAINEARQDEARFQRERLGASSVVSQNQGLRYNERTVSSWQAHGLHRLESSGWFLNDAEVDWTLSLNSTEQDDPDNRLFANNFDTSDFEASFPGGSQPDTSRSQRIFREIAEDSIQIASNFTTDFNFRGDRNGELRFGVFREDANRDYFQRSFTYTASSSFAGSFSNGAVVCNFLATTSTWQGTGPDSLWTDVFLQSDRIGLAPRVPMCEYNPQLQETPASNRLLWVVRPLVNDVPYEGDQVVDAGYAMATLPITPKVEVVAGARYETTQIDVVPFNENGVVRTAVRLPSGTFAIQTLTLEEATVDISSQDLLPSLSVNWEIRPDMFLRAAASRTLARPTFRELAPVVTVEFLAGDEFVGNTDLKLSSVENYDLRWEWFRRPGEVAAISLFAKDIQDPIELLNFVVAGPRSMIQPINYERGALRGLEAEFRFPFEGIVTALEGFTVGFNMTLLDSEVDVPLIEQDNLADYALEQDKRQLQGQPDSIYNASLLWDDPAERFSVGVFYNRTGETLVTGASTGEIGGVPNVFQTPFARWDFSFGQKFLSTGIKLTARVRNFTGEDQETVYRTPSGNELVKTSYETPVEYSLGAGWSW